MHDFGLLFLLALAEDLANREGRSTARRTPFNGRILLLMIAYLLRKSHVQRLRWAC